MVTCNDTCQAKHRMSYDRITQTPSRAACKGLCSLSAILITLIVLTVRVGSSLQIARRLEPNFRKPCGHVGKHGHGGDSMRLAHEYIGKRSPDTRTNPLIVLSQPPTIVHLTMYGRQPTDTRSHHQHPDDHVSCLMLTCH